MNAAIKTIIVDDEPLACRRIRRLLQADPEIQVAALCTNGPEAVREIESHRPDLLFLDIQMPGMDGFKVLKSLQDIQPQIIFVTAYDRYAIQAFEVHALDYLLKPFDQERFHKSFQRARAQMRLKKENTGALQRLMAEINRQQQYAQRILVSSGARYFFVKVKEILFISAEEKYVRLNTEKSNYLLRRTLEAMARRLDPAQFVRIHRSHLVNLDHIQEVQPWAHGDCIAILKNGTRLAVSRRYRAALLDKE